jgi:hypothetical protein
MSPLRPRVFFAPFAIFVIFALTPACTKKNPPPAKPHEPVTLKSERLVGIGYQTWFPPQSWDKAWDEPLLGRYDSGNERVIRQHAEWLKGAGVDFVWIDWSNNLTAGPGREDLLAIEWATRRVFDVYASMPAASQPKISIFLGCPDQSEAVTNGAMTRKADQVYATFITNPRYRPLVQNYLGKPLLAIYVGTPAPTQFRRTLPLWDDERFTVRWMTGFLDDQPELITLDGRSRLGYWSWWDRSPQTFAVDPSDDVPEAMVVTAAYPGRAGWDGPDTRGRRGGATFREQWARARAVGPRVVVVNSFNEWVANEEHDPERSNDLEPSRTWGTAYLELLTEEIARFKALPVD